MTVCRKTRVVKLTVFLLLLVGALYLIIPAELTQALAQFAPPRHDEGRGGEGRGESTDDTKKEEVKVMNQKRKHSDSETYLTPGNPGNFEPLRDEEEEGPGEKGVAHHTKPEQADRVDESINEYGKNPEYKAYYHIPLS